MGVLMQGKHAEDDLAYVRSGAGADLDTVLVFNLQRTHAGLAPFLDADLGRDSLTAAQFNALLALRSAEPDGLMMSEIGARLAVTPSNVTGLVDRLERQGFVARTEHRDRRATVVRLTEAGAAVLDRATPRHTRMLGELTACLADDEKRTLVGLLTKLRRALRERRAGGQ